MSSVHRLQYISFYLEYFAFEKMWTIPTELFIALFEIIAKRKSL